MKYRKKPVVIDAIKLEGTRKSIIEVLEFIGQEVGDLSNFTTSERFDDYVYSVECDGMHISTLEGGHIATVGDMIIKGVHGEFYPCKPDIFEKTYEKVEDD